MSSYPENKNKLKRESITLLSSLALALPLTLSLTHSPSHPLAHSPSHPVTLSLPFNLTFTLLLTLSLPLTLLLTPPLALTPSHALPRPHSLTLTSFSLPLKFSSYPPSFFSSFSHTMSLYHPPFPFLPFTHPLAPSSCPFSSFSLPFCSSYLLTSPLIPPSFLTLFCNTLLSFIYTCTTI